MTPTPYYQDELAQLYHGDCRKILPALNLTEGADACIADPPYKTTSLDWDRKLVVDWIPALDHVLKIKASMWLFGSMRSLLSIQIPREWKFAQDIVWEKQNGANFHADRFRRVHEHVVQFYRVEWREVYHEPVHTMDAVAKTVRRKKRPTHMGHIEQSHYVSHDGGPKLMRSVLKIANCHGYAVHPTQKPEDLIRPLVEYSVPPGGLVLDPFAGSGTTLVVAARTGRRAIGVEISLAHCESAAQRLRVVAAERRESRAA